MNKVSPIRARSAPVEERVARLDWRRIAADLAERGCASTGPVLTRPECEDIAAGYDTDASFRSRVVMARHGFGRGAYKYYAYPLPDLIAALRTTLYPRLAPVAHQ